MAWEHLTEAEIVRYSQDLNACLRRLDDEIDRVVFLQQKVRNLENTICDLKDELGRRRNDSA